MLRARKIVQIYAHLAACGRGSQAALLLDDLHRRGCITEIGQRRGVHVEVVMVENVKSLARKTRPKRFVLNA
jgi:hypothetical protein